MRIAILGSRGYPSTYGGFETFVRRLAPWLVTRGHDVTVYGRSDGRRRQFYVDGIRVIETVGLSSKSASTVTHGLAGALDCARQKYDAVLALNVANGIGLPVLAARGIPVAMNVDGIEWERGKWGPIARAGFLMGARASARHAATLIADSKEIARVWEERFGVDPTFIPYGADVVEEFGCERILEHGLTPKTYALVVARLAPENNVELFVDALAHLEWRVPAVIVGSANYDNPLEERLRRLSAEGKLLWLGHVSDQALLSDLWANAGVYFHGHSVGGTNPALLQALGAGSPTIALDTPFNSEVIGDPEQLVPNDPARLAEALAAVLQNHKLQLCLSTKGKHIVRSRYLWIDVLRRYEEALQKLASGNQNGC